MNNARSRDAAEGRGVRPGTGYRFYRNMPLCGEPAGTAFGEFLGMDRAEIAALRTMV
jgi:hypothetical protein